jgi:lipoprotein-anchoring transpeptidase ErfK/SrfK
MRFRFANPKRNQTGMWPAHLAIAVLATLISAGNHADAADRRSERQLESIASRTGGDPIMAIVSLHNQRITIYDADGWILRAPVSSGQKERETPAGIFSVIEKDADHHSNLYDDAYMPHMRRPAGLPGVPWLRSDALRLCRTPVRHDRAGPAGDRGSD